MPLGQAHDLGEASDIEEHVLRTSDHIREAHIKAIDQVVRCARERTIEAAKEAFRRRSESLEDAGSSTVGLDSVSDCLQLRKASIYHRVGLFDLTGARVEGIPAVVNREKHRVGSAAMYRGFGREYLLHDLAIFGPDNFDCDAMASGRGRDSWNQEIRRGVADQPEPERTEGIEGAMGAFCFGDSLTQAEELILVQVVIGQGANRSTQVPLVVQQPAAPRVVVNGRLR